MDRLAEFLMLLTLYALALLAVWWWTEIPQVYIDQHGECVTVEPVGSCDDLPEKYEVVRVWREGK